jgi:hypothetical protein
MSGQARSTGTFWDIIGIAYKYPLSKLKEKS